MNFEAYLHMTFGSKFWMYSAWVNSINAFLDITLLFVPSVLITIHFGKTPFWVLIASTGQNKN